MPKEEDAITAPPKTDGHIGYRILALLGIAVLVGFTILGTFYNAQQEHTILAQNERTMRLLTQSVRRGLVTVMLAGYADIAQGYAENLKKTPGIIDFHILRVDGDEAFQDNKTIHAVNSRLGEEEFIPREEERHLSIIGPDNPALRQVLDNKTEIPLYQVDGNGEQVLTILAPILLQKECRRCHGGDHEVRGVVKLTTSLTAAREDIAVTRLQSLLVTGVVMTLILALTFLLIRNGVVHPIVRMTRAMVRVEDGDLEERVPVEGRDELARMAVSFNNMAMQLRRTYDGLKEEQDKLTTIILSAREGIVATDRKGQVVIVNPATERHLGKTRERIVAEGFSNLLDDPAYIQAFLEGAGGNLPETIVYNQKVFNFYAAAIRTSQGELIGSAALIRDITEEKRLQDRLLKLSTTDALTGLFNRRRFDEALVEELHRARRYDQPLTVLLMDVDHFKKFNDTHGHDQGDRVLKALAEQMRQVFRKVDYPCRYGGEEFCAILPSTAYPGAHLAAERLRQGVEDMEVDGLKVTISIGVAIFPLSGSDPDGLVKAADLSLYASKKAGRNRVTFLDPQGEAVDPPAHP